MRTTAILNLKGGVGKTTTVINMAAVMARQHNKRVLVVDADSQCNTTDFLDCNGKCHYNLATLLTTEPDKLGDLDAIAAVTATEYEGLFLIPATDSLMGLDLNAANGGGVHLANLGALLTMVQSDFDYCIIDCPPAFSASCAAALIGADDVIIPVKLDAFSLRGMMNLMCQIRNMRKINPRLRCAGLLPTMWYKDPQIEQAEAQLRGAGLRVLPRIRASRKVDTMTWRQEPLIVCSPHSAAGVDYKRFVVAYLGGECSDL